MTDYKHGAKRGFWQSPSRWAALLLLLSIVVFVLYALYFDAGAYSVFDDSFISFRYAHNLSRGYGLVFNPGERVEGYTNFLWTVLMAGAIALGADVIVVSKVAAVLAGIATMGLVFQMGRQELGSPYAGVLAAAMLGVTTGFARLAVSGFEMLLYGMLVALGVYLYLRSLKTGELPFTAGAALALAAMTRPEGVLVFGVVTLHCIAMLVLRPGPLKGRIALLGGWLAGFGLLYIPYFAWRYTYYGYLLPNTFYTKVGEFGLSPIMRGVLYLRDVLLLTNPQGVLCLILGLFWCGRRSTQTLLYGLVGLYLSYLVIVGGDVQRIFGTRFLIPLWPFIYTLGVGGALGLARRLEQRRQRLLWTGLVGAFVCIFVVWSGFERRGYFSAYGGEWLLLGQWLAVEARPDDTLAVDAAGIIPYYSDLYTIDMFGLNDLHIAHLDIPIGPGLAGHEKFDAAYVLARRPTYIATWLSQDGHPRQAGLPAFADQLETDYTLRAVVLNRPPLGDEAMLIVDPIYTPNLYDQGYMYGLFRRREIESK